MPIRGWRVRTHFLSLRHHLRTLTISTFKSVPIEAKHPRPEDHPGIPGQNENQNLGRSPIELFTPLARNPTSQ
eukprot:scaffold130453_cov45-Cyclotella_meneghiniana.AAC.1